MKTQLPPPLEQLPTSSAPPPSPPPPAWSSGAGRSWGRRWRLLRTALHKLAAIVSLILLWPSCLSKFHNFVSIIVFYFFDLDFRFLCQLPCSAVWCESCKSDKVDWKVAKLTGKLCWKVWSESFETVWIAAALCVRWVTWYWQGCSRRLLPPVEITPGFHIPSFLEEKVFFPI